MVLQEGALVAWLLVALPVGLFVTTFAGGRGYGRVADVGIGILGALLGIAAAGLLGLEGEGNWLAGLLATVAGALLVTMLARVAPGRSTAWGRATP